MSQTAMDQIVYETRIFPPVTHKLLDEIVRRILSVGSPLRVVLFGSRARGDNKPDSDLDILIVEESDSNLTGGRYEKALRNLYPEWTVLVFSMSHIEEWKYVPSYIATVALAEGKVLYEDKQRLSNLALLIGAKSRVAEDEIQYKTPADLAKGWFTKAQHDFETAETMLTKELAYDTVCFHAQQAAEKYLKGFLALHSKLITKTHHLKELVAICQEIEPMPELNGLNLDKLSTYAVVARYSHSFWPQHNVAAESLSLAKRIREIVIRRVPSEALPS